MPTVTGYHAHVYFDQDTMEQARELCEGARDRFDIPMGRMHPGPIGPHPEGSCQLTVAVEKFAEVIPWLSLNRAGLTILVHAETGQHVPDHTDYAMWMGSMPELDISFLESVQD